jgi:hypothetical protein
LDKSQRFFEPNSTAMKSSVLIMKDKERRARRSAAQHDKMRVKQRERCDRRKQILISNGKNT